MFNQRYNSSVPSQTEQDEQEEARAALRWRSAILRLSENLRAAADKRSELSPFLMEGLHNALENLLLHGKEDDLMLLEEWLEHENSEFDHHAESSNASDTTRESGIAVNSDTDKFAAQWLGYERRAAERRFAERRLASHFPTLDSSNSPAIQPSPSAVERRILDERRAPSSRRADEPSSDAKYPLS